MAPSNGLWLDSLDISKMTAGWQTAQPRKSILGLALKLGGVAYPHGVGTHADSDFSVQINGAIRFTTMVGVDDLKKGEGSVRFMVYVDGVRVADSGTMKGGQPPKQLSVDLTGSKILTLHADSDDDGQSNDHADWAGALFLVPAGALAPVAIAPVAVPDLVSSLEPPIAAMGNSPQPAIHGPRITGATPGRPFIFKIPATGKEPLRYAAPGLPQGLSLDAETGIITGKILTTGKYLVQLTVSNDLGVAGRNLVIDAGERKLALTPPMGWNSWNAYHTSIDEKKMRDAVDSLRKTGLDRRGYQYINVDDAWQAPRSANGEIGVNEKFGSMKSLGDFVHGYGLKFGVYSSPGPDTCGGYPGSFGFEARDAKTFASWGADLLKYDWCSYGNAVKINVRDDLKKPYRVMRAALDDQNRDIVYSLCQYGYGEVWQWGAAPDIAGNLWRTTEDIEPTYASMEKIGFGGWDRDDKGGPGHWNDLDMLYLHPLKPVEQLTHLTLWSLRASPLLIGSDLNQLSPFTLNALSNDEVIEVNQDPVGLPATRVAVADKTEVWARPLWDGTVAVALFNRGKATASVTASWQDLGLTGPQPVRDLWRQENLGIQSGKLTASIPGHGAALFKIGRPRKNDFEG